MSIGVNIKRLREESGLSQEQLARMVNRTRSAISQYEHGYSTPRMGVIEDMARIFGVQKSEIIEDTDYAIMTIDLSPDERDLLKAWRKLNPANKAAVLQLANTLSSNTVISTEEIA